MSLPLALVILNLTNQFLPYLNPRLPVARRAGDLVGRMTTAEKIGQMMHVAPAIKRLGIPAYTWWSEALHGAVGDRVTVFPQAIGLAATFDTTLVGRVAKAISDEGRARYEIVRAKNHGTGMHEGLDFWAPNINIFRHPLWGRGQETYGEDPFLTGQMAVAYVKNLQGEERGKFKAIATPKHFAVHSGPDRERHHFDAVVDSRDIWNTYLPAFRAAVVDGGAMSVMSAYSALNGHPDSASDFLLEQVLRKSWGFQGYVVSDCGAIGDIVYGHHAAPTLAEGDALAVNAGCDLECGDAYQALQEAVNKKLIPVATLDRSLTRLFEARIRLGMFDPPTTQGPWQVLPAKTVDSAEHRALAWNAARKSVVLLKNNGLLPLRGFKSIAVIGPTAADVSIPLGNYNGSPSHTVSVREGIERLAPKGVEIRYTKGSSLLTGSGGDAIPAAYLEGGVDGTYFKGEALRGAPILRQHTDQIDFDWASSSPAPSVPVNSFSARWTTTLVPKVTGIYSLGTRSDDGSRLFLDDKKIVENWSIHAATSTLTEVTLNAGQHYRIRMEYFEHDGDASVKLVWQPPVAQDYSEAVALAKSSDVSVLVLGISGEVENEENDRTNIDLPAPQQGLLKAVLATGKPVVVVLESGSCLAVADPRIGGIVQAWYPGEEGGTAVAETLFGKNNPSGRLPVTFYRSLAQVPPISDYKMENRTYRYLHIAPLYGFGYGLSFSRFEYSRAAIKRQAKLGIRASITVKNVGKIDGDEVVQVYASRNGAAWPEPTRRLVAFRRIHLRSGESRKIAVKVDMPALAQADAKGKRTVLPGDYAFSVGGGQPGLEPATSGLDQTVFVKLPSIPVANRRQKRLAK